MRRLAPLERRAIAAGLLAIMAAAAVVIFVAIHLAPREPWALWGRLLAGVAAAAVAIFAGVQNTRRPSAPGQNSHGKRPSGEKRPGD